MKSTQQEALPQAANPAGDFVERDDVLGWLQDRLRSTALGTGHTVLVAGEAGIGKTSLLQALAERRGEAKLWWGACDALHTPHPLTPLQDIARSLKVAFGTMLGPQGDRALLFEAVLAELRQSHAPTLVVIEDVHWADEATLDLIRFLGRRVDRAACLMVVTYRDDELAPAHPLRRMLGDLPGSLVSRVELPRLSPAAVDALARRASRSSAGIYAATQGNPFFVAELLRSDVEGVPRSVQDLVLARFARLSPGAQAIARLASVVPAKIERWLVEELLGAGGALAALLEECLNSGLLTTAASALRFRHELARAAVEASLSEPVAQALHGKILDALADQEVMAVSPARLVHHATRAGRSDAVLSYAPEAALQARQRGAHREAASHYRTALQHAGAGAGDADRAAWLDAYARECQLTDQLGEAIDSRLQLDGLFQRSGDVTAQAGNLNELALLYSPALKNAEANAASLRAIGLLEALPSGVPLASAYRVQAQLRMFDRECEASVAWAQKAIGLADRFGHRPTLAAAFATMGMATLLLDYEAGCAHLQHALDLALADGLHHVAANAYGSLGLGSFEVLRLREAQRHFTQTVSFAQQHEMAFYRNMGMSWLSLCEMYLGQWDDAEESALDVLQETASHRTAGRVMALLTMGRLHARRGDPRVAAMLDEALELTLASKTPQRVIPVRAARAEAAWLRGDMRMAAQEARLASGLETRHRHPGFTGEAAYWLHRAGALHALAPVPEPGPFALQIQGRWREAAEAWGQLDCPYEQARALAEGDATARIEALAVFERLGARPAADALRQQLRAGGHKGIPRGLRSSTQANPHQLTAREVEVLQLLCEGLKNSQIAERLCRSVRTVDHHLAAAFSKLGVGSRTQAMAAALRSGIRPKK